MVAQHGLQHPLAVAELVEQSDHDWVQRPLGCFELGAREDWYDSCHERRCVVRVGMAPGEYGVFRQAQDDRIALAISRQRRPLNTCAKRRARCRSDTIA